MDNMQVIPFSFSDIMKMKTIRELTLLIMFIPVEVILLVSGLLLLVLLLLLH